MFSYYCFDTQASNRNIATYYTLPDRNGKSAEVALLVSFLYFAHRVMKNICAII